MHHALGSQVLLVERLGSAASHGGGRKALLALRQGQIVPDDDGYAVVEAEVPLAELQCYATQLRSLTPGRGTYTMEFGRCQEVPQDLA